MSNPFARRTGAAVKVEPPRGRTYRIKGLVQPFNYSPAITGQEQGRIDAARTEAIRRGTI